MSKLNLNDLRIKIPMFEIASNPTIQQIKNRRFNLIITCCVCGTGNTLLIQVDLDLNEIRDKQNYAICYSCLKKTKRKIARIKKMDPRRLPLYINDPNVFVCHFVSKKLEV